MGTHPFGQRGARRGTPPELSVHLHGPGQFQLVRIASGRGLKSEPFTADQVESYAKSELRQRDPAKLPTFISVGGHDAARALRLQAELEEIRASKIDSVQGDDE